MMFSVEVRRQRQPLTFRPMPASNGVKKHARHNVVIRVRGCRMTKIQAQLYGMRAQQGVLFRGLLVVENNIGVNVSCLPR